MPATSAGRDPHRQSAGIDLRRCGSWPVAPVRTPVPQRVSGRADGILVTQHWWRRLLRGITGREFELLELVADGLTNSDIDARLILSTRTVDNHVAALLAKTGAANRAEHRAQLLRAEP